MRSVGGVVGDLKLENVRSRGFLRKEAHAAAAAALVTATVSYPLRLLLVDSSSSIPDYLPIIWSFGGIFLLLVGISLGVRLAKRRGVGLLLGAVAGSLAQILFSSTVSAMVLRSPFRLDGSDLAYAAAEGAVLGGVLWCASAADWLRSETNAAAP